MQVENTPQTNNLPSRIVRANRRRAKFRRPDENAPMSQMTPCLSKLRLTFRQPSAILNVKEV